MNKLLTTRFSERKRLLFQKFSRKKYAAFNSMHRIVHISVLAATYSLIVSPLNIFAQSDSSTFTKVINIEEVEIVGQKSPTTLEELPRIVSVVTSKEISRAPAQSISDLLRYSGNIDVRQRGKSGIQGDISIRGGSFDQTLILFNGTNISDPQTGHLSLILPVDIDAINCIEILNGPAARVHGPNAFSGVVNFVTKPFDENTIRLSASGGQYGYFNASALLNLTGTNTKNLLYFNTAQSDGEYINTDFKRKNLFYQGQIYTEEGVFDFQMGYSDRAFGASGYYSPKYPDQFEKNQMTFASLSYKTGKKIQFQPKVYWRRHRDHFEIFREGDDWYTVSDTSVYSNDPEKTEWDTIISPYFVPNNHINDVYGVQCDIRFSSILGKTALGWNLRSENIISNNLGVVNSDTIAVRGYPGQLYTKSDNRTNFDLYFEQGFNFSFVNLTAGALINWNSYLPDEINVFPGVDLRCIITKNLSFISSYNYTMGLPTFTDLYYHDPGNEGTVDLKPYSQNSIEGGFRYFRNSINLSVVGFYSEGKKIIDWVWYNDKQKYRPINTDKTTSSGIELTASNDFSSIYGDDFFLQSLSFSYTYNKVTKKIDNAESPDANLSKYYNPENMASAIMQFKFLEKLILSCNFSYMQREGGYLTYDFDQNVYINNEYKPYMLFDTRLSYNYKWITIFGEITNLMDENYVDVGSIYQPGRWITAGIKFELSGFKL